MAAFIRSAHVLIFTGIHPQKEAIAATHLPQGFAQMSFTVVGVSAIYLIGIASSIPTASAVSARSDGAPRTRAHSAESKVARTAQIEGAPSSEIGAAMAPFF